MIHSGRSYNCFSFCLSFSCAVLSKASGIISYAGLIGTSFAIRMNFLQDTAALVFQRAWAFESPVRHKKRTSFMDVRFFVLLEQLQTPDNEHVSCPASQ